MPKAPLFFGSLAILLSQTIPSQAADEAAVVADAARMLNQMARDPNTGVPLELLRRSEGVILVPNMLNAGFVVGAKFGRGVFLVRDSKGRWGNPVLIDVAGGSFGLQAGAQATELLMVIRKQDTVTRLLAGKGKITLGVDAGVAAGPSGTALGAETDIELRAEILSYARSRGLFAGASLGGARVWVNRSANGVYYDNFAATTYQVIEGDSVTVPLDAAKLKGTVTALIDPPAEDDEGAPVDRKVSRSSRTRRSTDDDADEMPSNRTAARKRRPADDPDDAPPPRTARRKSADPDDDPPPARSSTRRARPANDDGEPVDDDPPPRAKRRTPAPSSKPTNPDDTPDAP
jgi:SH3 domain-containing YSC84-like protein 1